MKQTTEHDLPLFSWSPPQCEVIPFPSAKRIGRIRKAVEVISTRKPKGAEAYWRQITEAMRRQMDAAGLDETTIEAEVSAFAAEVAWRLPHEQDPRLGGGDAA
tara:strand:- start:1937 stop:2245 length:309 start_codon:yes stop_codon:yes gene_type:complete